MASSLAYLFIVISLCNAYETEDRAEGPSYDASVDGQKQVSPKPRESAGKSSSAPDLSGEALKVKNVNCQDLETTGVRSSRTINYSSAKSPTDLPARYVLTRTGQKDYKATIRLNFLPAEDAQFKEDVAKMKRKIQSCFENNKEVRDLVDPDGRSLKIEVKFPRDQDSKSPMDNMIVISDQRVARHKSYLYSTDISCPVLTHELFHLMGLVDEYPEADLAPDFVKEGSGSTEATMFDCRVTTKRSSIMWDPEIALEKRFQKPYLRIGNCICNDDRSVQCSAKALESVFEKAPVTLSCPSGYHPRLSDDISPTLSKQQIEKSAKENLKGGEPQHYFFLYKNTQETPTLTRTQMNAIIFNGCEEKNKAYYGVAKRSLRSSYEYPDKKCPPVPPDAIKIQD